MKTATEKYQEWTAEQLCDYLVEMVTKWAEGREFPQLKCFIEDIKVHLLEPDWFEDGE